jgi:hypothetical protein
VHGEHVGGRGRAGDTEALGAEQRQVVEAADARRRRRHGERQVADPLEQEPAADAEREPEAVRDRPVHDDVAEPERERGGERAGEDARRAEAVEAA